MIEEKCRLRTELCVSWVASRTLNVCVLFDPFVCNISAIPFSTDAGFKLCVYGIKNVKFVVIVGLGLIYAGIQAVLTSLLIPDIARDLCLQDSETGWIRKYRVHVTMVTLLKVRYII